MDKYVFAFEDIDSLFIAVHDVRIHFFSLHPVSDIEKLQMTISVSELNPEITYICRVIENAGGKCIA